MTVTLTTIDLGEVCSVIVKVRDPRDDALVDATVSVRAMPPGGGADLTATVAKVRQGVYEALFAPDQAGTWRIMVEVSGTRAAVEYGLVRVRPAPTVT